MEQYSFVDLEMAARRKCFATMGPEPKTTSILEPLPTEMLASEFGEMIRECR